MVLWKLTLIAVLLCATVLAVLLVVLYHLLCQRKGSSSASSSSMRRQGYKQGLSSRNSTKQQARYMSSSRRRKRTDYAVSKDSERLARAWRSTYPAKPFEWSEHPTHVAEALENRWTAWAFTYTGFSLTPPSSPSPSSVSSSSQSWGICTSNNSTFCKREHEPEIVWEISHGSEYIQKLWFNPGLPPQKACHAHALAFIQSLQSVLPLPGPPLVGSRLFPQIGYFEVTIIAEGCSEHLHGDASRSSIAENELAKLISKGSLSEKFVEENVPSEGNGRSGREDEEAQESDGDGTGGSMAESEEDKAAATEKKKNRREEVIAIGLGAGRAPPFRFPGHEFGSVGYHSNGKLYLNGALLQAEQERGFSAVKKQRVWGGLKTTTVGCGFDPQSRNVFFTVDGDKVCEVVADSCEFGRPLFPTVASNCDVTVLVNFGQIAFEYAEANKQRSLEPPYFSRPCSRSTLKNDSVNEDSADLFSIERIDSHWPSDLQIPGTGTTTTMHRHALSESESELFEIALEA